MQESRKTEFPYAAYMSYQKLGRGTTQQQNIRRRHWSYLSFQDYWVGALAALLSKHERLEDTAVLIVGVPSRRMNPFAQNALSPDRLHMPMILYLPGVKPQAGQLKLAGDLVDIGPTILELLGKQGGDKVWAGLSCSTLVNRVEAPKASSAQTAFGRVIRYGDWIWWPTSQASSRLWRHNDLNSQTQDVHRWPIVVRAMKDRMSSGP